MNAAGGDPAGRDGLERGKRPILPGNGPHASPDVPGEKSLIRKAMRAWLRSADPRVLAEASASLARRLIDSRLLAGAQRVMLYAPLPSEPDLTGLALELAASGVQLAMPRVDWSAGTMSAALWADPQLALPRGPRGVAEPPASAPTLHAGWAQVIVVPGLAFDEQGHRLGRGAGFYDRFLCPLRPGAGLVGVGFEGQIVPVLPVDGWDVPMDAVVTERRVIRGGPA